MILHTQAGLIGAAAVNVIDASLHGAQFAAQFSGIPALGGAVAVVLAIAGICERIQSNKEEALQLQERCKYLILALANEYLEQTRSSDMPSIIQGCTGQLEQVRVLITEYVGLSRWQLFARQKQISKDIVKCHKQIDNCCLEFQIRSQLQLHQWMERNKKAQEEDQKELEHLFKELKSNNDEVRQIVIETGEQVSEILSLLQSQLEASFLSPKRRQDSTDYHKLEHSLYNLWRASGEFLPGTDLKAGEVRRTRMDPVAGSAAFDIFEGLFLGQEKVALKSIRGVQVSEITRQRFIREVSIWRKVWSIDRGRYILPFYGACFDDGPYLYMVSPWMNNGDVMQYLSKNPYANRLHIIKGIAGGLSFLHNLDPPIAHGDVKAANVLINDSGQPVLADFGLSKILENITGVPFTQSRGVSDSYRWFAPELSSIPGVISTYSDVFSFGMTIVEIFTGAPPFDHIKRTTEVLLEMQKGDRPRRPTDPSVIRRGLDNRLWNIITKTWDASPQGRPSIDQILAQL